MNLKRAAFVGSTVPLIVSIARPAAAHGLGGRADLPIPLPMFLGGASAVIILSFAALSVLWPEHRLQTPMPLRRIVIPGFRWFKLLLRIAGVVFFVFMVATAIFGVNNPSRNPASILLWVGFWLVIPFVSAVSGNIYRYLNPFPTLAEWLGLGSDERPELAETYGVYAAAGVLLAFTWVETVHPEPAAPRTVAIMALGYLVYMLVAIERLGRDTAIRTADGFSVYNSVISGIAPFTTDEAGEPAWRGWLTGLAGMRDVPGLSVFLVVMVGTVTYDGISATPWFRDLFGTFATTIPGGTVFLLVTVAVIGAGYLAACAIAAHVAREPWDARRVADRFAHTLVPIALAYAVAHYFTLILFEGQRIFSSLSDPFGTGLDLFGTVDRPIDFTVIGPTGVWYVQLAVIVIGHVLAVLLAHDRALFDFPADVAVKTQYAMLGLMVVLTSLGLAILAAG